jgi:acyl-CoA synthetase (AMP-forming)/AMP-acid ligase II
MTGQGANLGDVFRAHEQSDRLAIIDLHDPDQPREISFRELNAGCDAMARGLRRAGFGPGDRIAILALNRVEFLEVLFGAMRAGCVPVMINAKLPAEQVRFIIADSGARLVFADGDFSHLPTPDTPMVRFGTGEYTDFRDPGSFESFVPGSGDIAEQPYTSGSTGRPKGVLLGHAGQCWMVDALVKSRLMSANDRGIISAPLYHKNALLAVKSALAPGGTILLLARFDAEQYVRAIGRYGLTMLTGVPTMYALILQQETALAETDLTSVRRMSMGSAPASAVLLDNLAARFPGAAINLNYGITEGGPIVLSWRHPQGLPRPRTTVGTCMPGGEIRLEGGGDENQGILHVRNPGVMLGYHNLPGETARVLRDGWLDTGDILRRDGDGWYYFMGRADDMFVCGGENIYPGDVETLLERHGDVVQAVVVPAPNRLKANVPHAFIVARPGSGVDEATLKAYALEHGPVYAHPRRVFFIDALPLAGTNKIDRKHLIGRAAAAARADGTA